jgi:TPR repeat protein
LKGLVGSTGDAGQDARVAQSKLEVASVLRTQYGHLDLARELLMTAARDDGDVEAMLEVAAAYSNADWGVGRDWRTAVSWLEKAAEEGSGQAMAQLAVFYGGVKDEAKGAAWRDMALASGDELAAAICLSLGRWDALLGALLRLAVDGNVQAVLRVAMLFVTNGEHAKAVPWLAKAAECNLSVGQFLLGEALLKGNGVERDEAKAFYWFERAAIQGHGGAIACVCSLFTHDWALNEGNRIKLVDFARRQAGAGDAGLQEALDRISESALKVVNEAWELQCKNNSIWWDSNRLKFDTAPVFAWLQIAAEGGDKWAQYRIGRCFFDGECVTRDHVRASQWFLRSAEQQHGKAQLALAYVLHEGLGVARDEAAALVWANRAANEGFQGSASAIGWCLYTATGAARDVEKAIEWFELDAHRDEAQAQLFLGYCYAFGQGVVRDGAKAVQWFTRAAEAGYTPAQVGLGVRLKRGLGVTRDLGRAVEWFARAAECYDADAMLQLGICHFKGEGVVQDMRYALWLFRSAMVRGNAFALDCAAWCAAAGLGQAELEGVETAISQHVEGELSGALLQGEGAGTRMRTLVRDPMQVVAESEVWSAARPLLEWKFAMPW